MGIVTFAAPVAGLRGKVGGLVYSANKSGAYLKAWGKGSNPRTKPQTEHRAALVKFSQAWNGITAAQRTAWDTYAALAAQDKTNSLGETYSTSGFNWFVALTLNLDQAGLAQIDSAPVLGTPAVGTISVTLCRTPDFDTTTYCQMSFGDPNLTMNHVVKAWLQNSIGSQVRAELKAFMVNIVPNVGNRRIIFGDRIREQFGSIQIGQKMFASVEVQNSEGRRSVVVTDSIDVTA